MNGFNEMQIMHSLSMDTKVNWETTIIPIPTGMFVLESDTGKIKIGDGVKTYSNLKYIADQGFSSEFKDILDKVNLANGVLALDETGFIEPDKINLDGVTGRVIYFDTYSQLATAGTLEKSGMVMVLDASEDPTVSAGGALYGWDASLNGGLGGWLKIAEYESLDIDMTVFFNKVVETLDVINDGINFIKMLPSERDKLSTIEAGATVTNYASTSGAGALMTDNKTYHIHDGMDGLELDTNPIVKSAEGYYYIKNGTIPQSPSTFFDIASAAEMQLESGFYLMDLDGDGVANPEFLDVNTGFVTYMAVSI